MDKWRASGNRIERKLDVRGLSTNSGPLSLAKQDLETEPSDFNKFSAFNIATMFKRSSHVYQSIIILLLGTVSMLHWEDLQT